MTAKKKAPAKPRATRTREEVKEDFESLREELEDSVPMDPKTAELARARAAAVKTNTKDLSVEDIVTRIGGLELQLRTTLTALQGQVLDTFNLRDTLREAVKLEEDEISRLHNVDVGLAAIDVLVKEHEERTQALESQYAAKSDELARRIIEAERNFQEDIERKQRDAARKQADWEYQEQLRQRKMQDDFNQKVIALERSQTEKHDLLQKGWTEREKLLQQAESELKELRELRAGLDERIRKERAQAEAIAKNAIERDLTHKYQLEKKDLEQQLSIARHEAAVAKAGIAEQTSRIAALEGQLASARENVKEMALASFKEAGSAKALAELTGFAASQSNSNPKRS